VSRPLDWERDGKGWPNREASRFVRAAGIRWQVQSWGRGPTLLLVHGTGAATHSWRDLAPLLARRFTLVAPDLPGHGFTPALPRSLSLPAMAGALAELLGVLELSPALAVGHSAGAAILIRMSLDGRLAPKGIVSLNGALVPFRGGLSELFSPLAKLLFVNPLVPRLFAWGAGEAAVARMIRDTGSTLDPEGIALYARLVRNPAHIAGALGMMADWDLKPLVRDLPRLSPPLLLVVGTKDRAIPPDDALAIRERLPSAEIVRLKGLGHLAHEERPAEVAEIVERFARATGALPPEG
jgi:magnesium chelatase accessory protein